jgi:hypothetical protein
MDRVKPRKVSLWHLPIPVFSSILWKEIRVLRKLSHATNP